MEHDRNAQTGFLPGRVVQLHVTTRCNLACGHCYSSSSPHEKHALDVDITLAALRTLRDEGFERLSLSGGEPFLYADLETLIVQSAAMGLRVNLVSNGTRFHEKRLKALAPHVAAIAVSLDGMPGNHDRVRARRGAFDKALAGIRLLREHGIAHGVICCVTRDNLADVPDLYELARASGASLFQTRPLIGMGRGRSMAGSELDAEELERLVVLMTLLAEADRDFPVQCDLASTRYLAEAAGARHAALLAGGGAGRLSDVVNPWVIDERGRSQAFIYGGGTGSALPDVVALAKGETALSAGTLGRVRRLVLQTTRSVQESPARFSDWYAHVSRSAAQSGTVIGWPAA